MNDSNYIYFPKVYEGREILFRLNQCNGDIEIKADNNFALSNGFSSIEEMRLIISSESGMILPDWLMVESGLVGNIRNNLN